MPTLRLALRSLLRAPAPTLVIVFTLAVAIGVATIISGTIDSVWNAIPARDADRLVFVSATDPRPSEAIAGTANGVPLAGASVPDLVDWAARSTTMEEFAAFRYSTATLTGLDAPERATVIRATANLPSLWGMTAAVGRAFRTEDGRIGAAPVALLSDRYWRERFASRTGVVGSSVFIDGVSHTIVGVLPYGAGRGIFVTADVWVPQPLDANRSARDDRGFFVTARLKPGASRDQANAEIMTIANRLKTEYPDTNGQTGAVVRPFKELLGGETIFVLGVLALIASLVVAMACANVSNVVLAQLSARSREVSLRTMLGAGRWDHVKRVMTEGFLISAAASAAGLVIGAWGLAALKWLSGPAARVLTDAAVNGRVVAAGAVAAFLIPFVCSLLPAFQSWRPDPADLKQGVRATRTPGRRLRTALVALQVGFAVVLLVQVTLLSRMTWEIRSTKFGFDPTQVLTVKMDLAPARYAEPARIGQFYPALLNRIAAVPGVAAVGAINRLPIGDRELNIRVRADGAPPAATEALPQVGLAAIGGDYLGTMRVPLVLGRGFERSEISDGRPVALVSEATARLVWPGRDPVGSRASLVIAGEPERPVLVVGVVADVRSSDVFRRTTPQIYVPAALRPERSMALTVRSAGADPRQLVPALRAAAAAFEPNEPLFAVLSMEEVLYNDEASTYVLAGLLLVIAVVSLCLAAAGIYGVVSYLVVQRTREIGVRIALGANPARVSRMIVTQGARPVLGGGLLGLPIAIALALMMASTFNFIQARDLSTYVFVVCAIAVVAFLASYVPARRASRVDPVVALRAD